MKLVILKVLRFNFGIKSVVVFVEGAKIFHNEFHHVFESLHAVLHREYLVEIERANQFFERSFIYSASAGTGSVLHFVILFLI